MQRSAILCPKCGAIESVKSAHCHRCGAKLGSAAEAEKKVRGVLAHEFFATRTLQVLMSVHFAATVVYAVYLGGSVIEAFIPGDAYAMSIIQLGAIRGAAVFAGEWYRLVTAIFAHFGVLHLMFNSMALGAVGPETEKNLGRPKMLAVFLAGGVAANVTSLLWNGPQFFQAGASGAICALMGALYMIAKMRGGVYGDIVKRIVARWIVLTVLFGFLVPGIDNVAHIVGMIFGAVFVKFTRR